jgi:NAD-dependent SIR2 family protein deacetylase
MFWFGRSTSNNNNNNNTNDNKMMKTEKKDQQQQRESHGIICDEFDFPLPRKVLDDAAEARPGYQSRDRCEYVDSDDVIKTKVALLAGIIHKSKSLVVYSGAGISTASGIGDYATSSASKVINGRDAVKSPWDAQPTMAHRCLVALYRGGYVRRWVQQNHDGLPQKAGLPQSALNEIHGAWYDPSNPVVPMSGTLRSDLFEQLHEWQEDCDCCLSLGTSMCGMNADSIFVETANKYRLKRQGFGGIIINLQKTVRDDLAALRINGTLDVVLPLLVSELKCTEFLPAPPPALSRRQMHQYSSAVNHDGDIFFFDGYDTQGVRRNSKASNRSNSNNPSSSSSPQLTLDLSEGAKVKITSGMYQDLEGEVVDRNAEGHYRLRIMHPLKANATTLHPKIHILGWWWMEAAALGDVPLLPIVNTTTTT